MSQNLREYMRLTGGKTLREALQEYLGIEPSSSSMKFLPSFEHAKEQLQGRDPGLAAALPDSPGNLGLEACIYSAPDEPYLRSRVEGIGQRVRDFYTGLGFQFLKEEPSGVENHGAWFDTDYIFEKSGMYIEAGINCWENDLSLSVDKIEKYTNPGSE